MDKQVVKKKRNGRHDANQPMSNTVCSVAHTLQKEGKETIFSDTLGSYTGMGMDYDDPVQDADDL